MSAIDSPFAIVWFIVSSILVTWDACYCFGRPHTMEGGALHRPLWAPYKLYAEVDYIYGWKAFNEHNGFTNAQSALNVFETPGQQNKALMIGYTVSVMTLSKTILYWLQEYYSGFADIGHNTIDRLILLWIIPNGVWIVVPAILVRQFGAELMQKLNAREMKQK